MHGDLPRWNMTKPLLIWSGLVAATLASAAPWPASAQTQTADRPAQELNSSRKGFVVGIGGGGGLHDDSKDAGDGVTSAAGVGFKIGYAPTDQLLIHYSATAAFTRATRYDAVGISGVGVTYMARRTWPSFFVNGIVGEGGSANVDRRDWGEGVAFAAGGGYEFRRHWSISGDALFIRLGGGDNHVVLLAMLNYLFY
jgi:hypothetical protein